MDDDNDFEFVTSSPVQRRAIPFDFVVLGAFLLDELAGAIHSTATAAYNLAAMHANYLHDQATFREEAALEIETMTTGESDG
jgi:hypothetical protein